MTISVLVACYNASATLAETLQSVLVQSRPPDELIVVDDGSTDHSVQVALNFKSHGVKLVRQANRGASAARNRAFAHSSGKHVIFLDADDLIGTNHLEALESKLADDGKSIAFSSWDRFYQSPSEARFPARQTEVDLPGADWLVRAWADARPMTQPGMFLIPRLLIESCGGWDERLSLTDDFEFFARVLSKCNQLRFAGKAQLFYRSGIKGSLSGQRSRKAIESHLTSLLTGTSYLLSVRADAEARGACAALLQDFDYSYYPLHSDLRARAKERVVELGGSSIEPDGPPGFHHLRRFVGWKCARRVQRLAERYSLGAANGVAS
ncbi:MAG: glycosyltransferase family 2 protein [Rubrivivax sp.]|nr:glycosyltransferase family 2 protein [Rubrivivax sp.]